VVSIVFRAGYALTGAQEGREKWAPAHNLTVEEVMKKFPDEVGISRFGKAEEIADLMAYLVSPAAKWMTEASVRVDGGERYLGQAPHADSKAPALFWPCWFVVCRSSLLVRQLRHRHPLVPWSGTGSVWGRSEHQQSCPGLQDMGELHCEQNAFMVGAFSVKPREMAAEGLFL
jgi:hypothetical protein